MGYQTLLETLAQNPNIEVLPTPKKLPQGLEGIEVQLPQEDGEDIRVDNEEFYKTGMKVNQLLQQAGFPALKQVTDFEIVKDEKNKEIPDYYQNEQRMLTAIRKNQAYQKKMTPGYEYGSFLLAHPAYRECSGEEQEELYEYDKEFNKRAKEVFTSPEPMQHPEYLSVMNDALQGMSDTFFYDRGVEGREPKKEDYARKPHELISAYELSMRADTLIQQITALDPQDPANKRNKIEVLESLEALKSQRSFLKEEMMMADLSTNAYFPYYDLNDPATIRALGQISDALDKEPRPDLQGLENDVDFISLCRTNKERWTMRAMDEAQAAVDMLTDPAVGVKENHLKIRLADGTVQDFDTVENLRDLLLAQEEDKPLRLYDSTDETKATDLTNNGKREWYTYRSQIDGNMPSYNALQLPEEPSYLTQFLNLIWKYVFQQEDLPEVKEYNEAKARLEMIDKAVTDSRNKVQAEGGTVMTADTSLVEQQKKERADFEKMMKTNAYAKFLEEWEKKSPQEKKDNMAEIQEYQRKKEAWDQSSEIDKQKSRMSSRRSADLLAQREANKRQFAIEAEAQFMKEVADQKQKFFSFFLGTPTNNHHAIDNALPYYPDRVLWEFTDKNVEDILNEEHVQESVQVSQCRSDLEDLERAINTEIPPKFEDEEDGIVWMNRMIQENMGERLSEYYATGNSSLSLREREANGKVLQENDGFSALKNYYMGRDLYAQDLKEKNPDAYKEELKKRHQDFVAQYKAELRKQLEHYRPKYQKMLDITDVAGKVYSLRHFPGWSNYPKTLSEYQEELRALRPNHLLYEEECKKSQWPEEEKRVEAYKEQKRIEREERAKLTREKYKGLLKSTIVKDNPGNEPEVKGQKDLSKSRIADEDRPKLQIDSPKI